MPGSCLKGRPVADKGWCWVMFVSTSVNMFLVFGVHYTYGILYPSLLKEFNRGQGNTGDCYIFIITIYSTYGLKALWK